MNEFYEMDETMKEVRRLLDKLKAHYLAEERQKKTEEFWETIMGEPLMANDVIAKGGFHDRKN
jgi:hypothetical protein